MKIINKISKKKINVAIIGLGYVGLELAINISKSGFNVFSFDKNIKKVNLLKKKKSTISTIENKRLNYLNLDNIFSMDKISLINNCDIIIICVPTPLKKNNIPDMNYVKDSLNSIYKFLRPEQMIILESTVYPGATEEIFLKKINSKKELTVGKNFYLSFSPERISPGKDYSIAYSKITKIVSGYSDQCLKIIKLFYKRVFNNIYSTKNIKVAEFTKLYENAYRSVNIGLVNQMKMIADGINLNIFDIIDAAKTKPFGFRPFIPGPGVGGHCIPVDPLFISWVCDKKKINSDFIKISRSINLKVTKWTISKIKLHLKKKNQKILLIGITYKKDVDDCRESPSISIFKNLKKNYKIEFFDPYVKEIKISGFLYKSIKNLKNLKKYNLVIIGTDHSNINYNLLIKKSKKIIDTRGVLFKKKSKKIILC